MTCFVFGGSGQIGHFLLPLLRQRGMHVVALSRGPRPSQDGLLWLRGGLPDAVPALPKPPSVILSLGPLDHFSAWLQQTDLASGTRIVAMSSMSAESKRESPDPAERALAARLHHGEQALLERAARSGCACTVLRATLIYGTGMDRSLTALVRFAQRWRVFPLPLGRGLRQPVHAQDLALAVLAALDCPASAGHILPIGGGERLTATAMFQRVHASLAPRSVPLPLPRIALLLGARLSGRGRGMADRLRQDLIADNTKLVRLLGVRPRPFVPRSTQGGESGRDASGNGLSNNL